MMIFKERLAAVNPPADGRSWLFVPYDQLSGRIGPLSREDPAELGIVVVENPWKAASRTGAAFRRRVPWRSGIDNPRRTSTADRSRAQLT